MSDTQTRVAAAWPDILASLASGDMVKTILERHGLTRRQISECILSKPEMRKQWDEARETSADAYMDEAMEIARSKVDKEYAQHARTHIDTLKWAARIRNPRLYGDKTQLDVNVKTVDLTAIIRDANARLAASKQNPAIEGQFQRIDNNRDALDDHMRAGIALDPVLAALL